MPLRLPRGLLLAALLGLPLAAPADAAPTQVGARYADGQVWVSWVVEASPPTTYAIYSAPGPFTSTHQGRLEGRLYAWEWGAAAAAAQTGGVVSTYRIPNGAGGVDTMATNRGLFVSTVHETDTRYWAVVRWGDTLVTAPNRSAPVAAVLDPADPPECHLQHEYVKDGTFLVRLYQMWADGRADHRDQRPDFPVMANHHKNGMPSLFFVSRRLAATTTPRPVTYWLHGGDGRASQSLPGDRPTVGIDPLDGLLVAHNDDFVFASPYAPGGIETEGSNSWWFGWSARHDPFDSMFTVAADDTIVNYTQRRLLWIHGWLAAHEGADPARAAIQGHSLGSAGTTALAKAFPELFSTATLYNNGFGGPDVASLRHPAYGSPADSLPTSLTGPGGTPVRFHDLFDLATPVSTRRDLPLFRVFHGKTDVNGTMMWDAEVVAQYRAADSLGLGMHLYWDERDHNLAPGFGHWFYGAGANDQTHRDDVATQEPYRRDRTYPGFFDHRLDPNGGDPGDGTRGTSADPVFSGDDWGTWGGYHDWDPAATIDQPGAWQASLFLTDPPGGGVDACPHDSLTCAVGVRKPQAFLPLPGTLLRWVLLAPDGDTLATDTVRVAADGLVVARGIALRKDQVRRLRFVAETALVGVPEPGATPRGIRLVVRTSPLRDRCDVSFTLPRPGRVVLDVFDAAGRHRGRPVEAAYAAGEHRATWPTTGLAPGFYALRLRSGPDVATGRFIVVPRSAP